MPSYDYECQACGYRFEVFQSMSEPPLTECPKCKKRVKRLIGGGLGVIFKGSGFYVTDNKRSSSLTGSKKTEDSAGESAPAKESSPAKEPAAPAAPAAGREKGKGKSMKEAV